MPINLLEIIQDTDNVAGILIKYNDEYMLCKRSSNKKDWSIPKGHIQQGEQPLEGAIRELEEETAIQLDGHPKQISTYKEKDGDFYIFSIEVEDKLTPILNHEHTNYGYFTKNNLPKPLDRALNFLKTL
tara:strand:- start:55 stop:441 length:387 start_codon:yes stop_codon:yes gene_type:complete